MSAVFTKAYPKSFNSGAYEQLLLNKKVMG